MPYTVDELINELNQCGRFDYAKVVELVAALNAGGGGGGSNFGLWFGNNTSADINLIYLDDDNNQVGDAEVLESPKWINLSKKTHPTGATKIQFQTSSTYPLYQTFAQGVDGAPDNFFASLQNGPVTTDLTLPLSLVSAIPSNVFYLLFLHIHQSNETGGAPGQRVFNATSNMYIVKVYETEDESNLIQTYNLYAGQGVDIPTQFYSGKYVRIEAQSEDVDVYNMYFSSISKTVTKDSIISGGDDLVYQMPGTFSRYLLITPKGATPGAPGRYTVVNTKSDGTALNLAFFDVDGPDGVQIGDAIDVNWLERYDFVPADFPAGATVVKVMGLNDIVKLDLFTGTVLNSNTSIYTEYTDYSIVLDIISASIGFGQSHFIDVVNGIIPTPPTPPREPSFAYLNISTQYVLLSIRDNTTAVIQTDVVPPGQTKIFLKSELPEGFFDYIATVDNPENVDFISGQDGVANYVGQFDLSMGAGSDLSTINTGATLVIGAVKTVEESGGSAEDTILVHNKTAFDTTIRYYDFINPSDYVEDTISANTTYSKKRSAFPAGKKTFKIGAPQSNFYYSMLNYVADGANTALMEKVTGVAPGFGFYLFSNTDNIKQFVLEMFDSPEVVRAGVFFQNETNAPMTIDFKDGSGNVIESRTLTAKNDPPNYPNQMLKIFYDDITPGVAYFTAPTGIGINITTHVLINNNGYANYYPGNAGPQDFGGVDPDIFYYFALLPA